MSSWSAHPKKARNNIVEGFKNHPEYFQQVFADHLAWLEEKNEQQETQIVQLIGEIESLNEIISGKDEEIARLKDEIARLSSKGCTTPEAEPVSDDAQKTKALEKENSLLKSKIAQLVTTICTMTVQIRQASQLHKNEVENLTKELKTVKNERNYLKKKEKMRKNWDRQKIQDQDNTIARLQSAYEQASQALCDAQKLIEDLQEEKNQDALRLERMVHSNSRISNFPSSMDICQREVSAGNKPEDREESDKKSDDISKSECSNSCIHPETIKRVPVSSRESSKNPRGGQSGHPAHISQLSDNPDSVQVITVKKAPSGAVPGVTAEGDPCFIVQRRGVKA